MIKEKIRKNIKIRVLKAEKRFKFHFVDLPLPLPTPPVASYSVLEGKAYKKQEQLSVDEEKN
jgi:hypothetical protein